MTRNETVSQAPGSKHGAVALVPGPGGGMFLIRLFLDDAERLLERMAFAPVSRGWSDAPALPRYAPVERDVIGAWLSPARTRILSRQEALLRRAASNIARDHVALLGGDAWEAAVGGETDVALRIGRNICIPYCEADPPERASGHYALTRATLQRLRWWHCEAEQAASMLSTLVHEDPLLAIQLLSGRLRPPIGQEYLAERTVPVNQEVLVRLFRHPDARVREAAVRALGRPELGRGDGRGIR